jgi:hypothetical protein
MEPPFNIVSFLFFFFFSVMLLISPNELLGLFQDRNLGTGIQSGIRERMRAYGCVITMVLPLVSIGI